MFRRPLWSSLCCFLVAGIIGMQPQSVSGEPETDVSEKVDVRIYPVHLTRWGLTLAYVSVANVSHSVIHGPLRLALHEQDIIAEPCDEPPCREVRWLPTRTIEGLLDPTLAADLSPDGPVGLLPYLEFDEVVLCPEAVPCEPKATGWKGPLVFWNPQGRQFDFARTTVAGDVERKLVETGGQWQPVVPPQTVTAITEVFVANGDNNQAIWENWPHSHFGNKPLYWDSETTQSTADLTGVSREACTEPYRPGIGLDDVRVWTGDVNEGIGGDFVGIWARYAELPTTSSQEVLTGIQATHWPNWDGTCPTGWERASGLARDVQGGLTTQTFDDCWRIGLCVRYEPLNQAEEIVTNLHLSRWEKGSLEDGAPNEYNCPALCGSYMNASFSSMHADLLNIHSGCDKGGTFEGRLLYNLCYNKASVGPAMTADAPQAPDESQPLLSSATLDVSDNEKYSLLRRHAPIVWLDELEEFWPSSVDWFFADESHAGVERVLLSDGNYWLRTLAALAHPTDKTLPIFVGQAPDAPPGESYSEAPVYGFWAEKTVPVGLVEGDRSGSVVDLVYFFFHPYNRGNSVGSLGVFGNHVGDWEHVTVRLEWRWSAELGWNLEPSQIYLSAHSFGGVYEWDDPAIEKDRGTHPVVYSARGSHGLWSTTGNHHYETLPFIGMHLVDETSAGTRWETGENLRAFLIDPTALSAPVDETGRLLQGPPAARESDYPLWMSRRYHDPVGPTPTDPWAGAVFRWGNAADGFCSFGECLLNDGPTGPVDKGVMTSDRVN